MEQRFSYHRTVAPMLWVFVGLAVVEMLAVHLFLTLRWPAIGWPLFLLSAASVVWLVLWIGSFRRCPHLLTEEVLQLRTGSLRLVSVPLPLIERVSRSWAPGEHAGVGASNVVPLAYPNRMLRLVQPMKTRRGMCDRIAFRVDDPNAFDAAMAVAGIDVE